MSRYIVYSTILYSTLYSYGVQVVKSWAQNRYRVYITARILVKSIHGLKNKFKFSQLGKFLKSMKILISGLYID